MGGDCVVLRAAGRGARPPRARRRGAADAVADAGAVRSARPPGRDRSVPGVPARGAARVPSPRRARAARGRGTRARGRARAIGRRVRGRRRAPRRAAGSRRGGAARRAGGPRALDLLGDARGAAAGRHRCRAGAAAAERDRLAPGAFRWMGGRPVAARVRPRRVAAWPAGGGRRPRDLRRADGAARARRPGAPDPDGNRRGAGAVADRPADDRADLGSGRLSVRRPLPRLSPLHDPSPPRLAHRRRAVRSRGRAGTGPGRRGRVRRGGP